MRKLFPYPWMTLVLWVVWMLLNETLAVSHALLGAVLAIFMPLMTRAMYVHGRMKVKKLWLAVLVATRVVVDITVSCWKVCKIILGTKQARSRSGFITIRLNIRSVYGMTILASIVNSTPGTVWTELSDDNRILLVHLLDLNEEQEFRRIFHERYEKPLMEIFE
ncbi:Na+/H+ antiporter subunit E [Zestomonas carbonaria]|uniref:Na(+)/H(+) antiporter subunit E n=1 Tax=Zestomonas carbonaria TaxID=2762745 RepID=A0A7U7ELD1_9GAMM|nr:Na+/H+ antiporter subunit E [Pseudomonas carbonaria]CAD5107138.1 Na(+)/H(+) antiporter subunit E [Pseudomonas carbonaria]